MGSTLQLTADDGHKLSAYRADPVGAPKAGIVVLQEIFGVNVHIREVCDGFARDGYCALAPALFDRLEPDLQLGYTADDVAAGRDYKGRAESDKALLDIEAARNLLAGECRKVGVVGYCWGGLLAWLSAARLPFDCAVSYYGGGIVNALDQQPNIPLIMHFGEVDKAIPMGDVDKIKASLEPSGLGPEVFVYPGADHGFNCDHRGTWNAEAAALARDRTLAFFANQLR